MTACRTTRGTSKTPSIFAALTVLAAFVHCTDVRSADIESLTSPALEWPIVCVQLPIESSVGQRAAPAGMMLQVDYGKRGRIVRVDPDGTTRVLTESFHSACELDVSFDAKRILFAGKQGENDYWAVWEMSADGIEPRRVIRLDGNCRTPAYQATFYTIVSSKPWYQIMFSSDLSGGMNELGAGPAYSLYSCRLDGESLRRLTMNPNDDLDPFLMGDGRLLLSSWQRGDRPKGQASLFGLNTDGTDYALFCDDAGYPFKRMPCVTKEGIVVFVETEKLAWDGAGQLGSVTLRRSLHSYKPITRDPSRLYHSPTPLPDGGILVSSRSSEETAPHALYRLDLRTGQQNRVLADPRHHLVHSRVLAPRAEPDGRSSVVDERQSTGRLYCLNTYIANAEVMPHLKPGMIKGLRVIEGVPQQGPQKLTRRDLTGHDASGEPGSLSHGSAGTTIRKRLLGVVDVMEDGSFHVEVPADIPIQLQTLDENGMALESCGWIWTKPREPRGCIGCHEDPELTPENRFVEALQQPGIRLTLPAERRRTVDFAGDVMPIVKAKCTGCHGSQSTGVDLRDERTAHFNRAYESLLAAGPTSGATDGVTSGRHVHPNRARTSPLVWRLWGRNTSQRWDRDYYSVPWSAACPPPGAAPLTADEKLVFVEWIDVGAQWSSDPGQASSITAPIITEVE